jgi:hypothetical protein
MSAGYVFRQEFADALGVHWSKVERLRQKGLIPEALRLGQYYVFPADQVDAIRERLARGGHLKSTPAATTAV